MANILQSSALVLLLSAMAWSTDASAGQRKSVTSLTASEIKSLRRGIAQMKAWNSAPKDSANYRRSWEYWADMHEYFGDGCEDPVGLTTIPGMSGLSEQHQTMPDQALTWCKCQHHNLSFLTWHRMYLYYFEKVLQAAAGDPDLQVPYWDYEADGHLPTIYQDLNYLSGMVVLSNPLYVANRAAPLNDGSAALLPIDTSTAGAYLQLDYDSFSEVLESSPHGAVHCAVSSGGCWSGYMGRIASAANDPIFWAHHSNIDRIYECWLRVNPTTRLPTDPAIVDETFSFPDGDGNIVTRRVGDMLTTAQLGYFYFCPGGFRHPEIPRRLPPFLVRQIAWRILGGRPTVIPFRISAQARAELQRRLSRQRGGLALLRLTGIRVNRPPHALYKISARDPAGRLRPLGLMSFFSIPGDNRGQRTHDMGSEQTLGVPANANAVLARATELVFEPTMGLTDAGDAARAAQLDAGVQITVEHPDLEIR
jgi:hypothetical protein